MLEIWAFRWLLLLRSRRHATRYLNVRDHQVSSIFAGDLTLEQAAIGSEIFRLPLIDATIAGFSLNQITIRERFFQPLPCSVRRKFHDACQRGLSPALFFSLRHAVGWSFVRLSADS